MNRMNSWSEEDIENIMLDLNYQNLPFTKYEFSALGNGMKLLGTGSSARVYEAVPKRQNDREQKPGNSESANPKAENYGKENYGKENREKENHGKENHEKENHGKENNGKENPGKENPGIKNKIRKKEKEYAIKVIGFGDKHADIQSFRDSVDAQKSLANTENNIVKIYDSINLRVWIIGDHTVEKAEVIHSFEEEIPGNYLYLQFILMEKVTPVISCSHNRRSLFERLEVFDEQEFMRLAYDIGKAINGSHKNNLIHRDIKLENIFYDEKKQHYKLGDFGIARTTDNGMASTVAFTKGYGAPEVVGTLEDKYDYTADIYSFGMLLYVLLNEMRFPESTDYHPNVYQYKQGYVPPEPVNGSDEIAAAVLKMLSYNPEDRYQSMEEVLNEFDKINYGPRIKYQREHKNAPLVLGFIFALLGAATWKLSFMPDLEVEFGVLEYCFYGLCIGKLVLHIFKKETELLSLLLFCLGLYLMISSGFVWWKLLLLLCLTIYDYVSGLLGGIALTINMTSLAMQANGLMVDEFAEYRWMAVLLISLAAVLLFFCFLLYEREEKAMKSYFKKNIFWLLITATYILLIFFANSAENASNSKISINRVLLGPDVQQWISSRELRLVGIFGTVFCIFWMLREGFLIFIERRLGKKK